MGIHKIRESENFKKGYEMIEIKTLNDYEKVNFEGSIPSIICNTVLGDILMFEKYLETNDSKVLIMSRGEFKDIEKIIPFINRNNYEYKDIVGVSNDYYITKLLYLLDNGESGIIVYVISEYLDNKQKFSNDVYITKNLKSKLPLKLLNLILKMVEKRRIDLLDDLDYLQVFEIENIGDSSKKVLKITHKQEIPEHKRIYYYEDVECENCKIFWISNNYENEKEYSTLMLAEDY